MSIKELETVQFTTRRYLLRAAVIIILQDTYKSPRDPHVLAVTNRRFGGFSLPGGKLDKEESPKQGAIRELFEETALHLGEDDLTLLCQYPNTISNEVCEVSVFHALSVFGVRVEREEGTKHDFMTWQQLIAASPFAQFYREHFPEGVRHLRGTSFLEMSF